MSDIPKIYDIIIIGGGISGIVMAYECIEKGYSVLLLEKSDRFGGRIYTVENSKYNVLYDAGAARISNHHKRVLKYIEKFKLETIKIHPHKYHRNVMNEQIVFDEKDYSEKLIQKIIKNSKIYSDRYLRSIPYQILCEKIIGIEESTKLRNMFGYDAEFTLCNAYDALKMFKRDFQEVGTYFVLKNGLSELINVIVATNKNKGGTLLIKQNVKKFMYNEKEQTHTVHVQNENGNVEYIGRSIVLALPKHALLEFPGWKQTQNDLLNSVNDVSLHRIFCKYPLNKSTQKVWFSDISRTTTNDKIRQIIPINQQNGLIQISYSDSKYADYWNTYANKSKEKLYMEIEKHIHTIFPEVTKIPKPVYIDSQYWKYGIHLWRPGKNSEILKKKIQQIYGVKRSIFIVGEAYSSHQGWIEGALETVEDVLQLIKYSLIDFAEDL
jgi:predicted NAD/FAD-dependent oxidoreductase